MPESRVVYDYDPDTGLLEVTIYFQGKAVLRELLTGAKAQEVLSKIREAAGPKK